MNKEEKKNRLDILARNKYLEEQEIKRLDVGIRTNRLSARMMSNIILLMAEKIESLEIEVAKLTKKK